MAKKQSVWGIEIGQTALKALRCSMVDGEVVADAFDFIEYPKILSQPEADAEELVTDAISQLLERNEGITDKVCVSVPGQSGHKFSSHHRSRSRKLATLFAMRLASRSRLILRMWSGISR